MLQDVAVKHEGAAARCRPIEGDIRVRLKSEALYQGPLVQAGGLFSHAPWMAQSERYPRGTAYQEAGYGVVVRSSEPP
jgi:hypothetical protein